MREITWPSLARVLSVDLRITNPGQITNDIPYTGQQQVFDTGTGLFEGTATIALTEKDSAAHRQIEAFFAAMGSARNWTALPHRRPTIPQISNVASRSSAGLYTVVESALPTGFAVGQYFTADDKLYIVTEITAGAQPRSFRCEPSFIIPDNTQIRPSTTIRAAGTDDAPMSPLTPDFAGPWVWQWRERA